MARVGDLGILRHSNARLNRLFDSFLGLSRSGFSAFRCWRCEPTLIRELRRREQSTISRVGGDNLGYRK